MRLQSTAHEGTTVARKVRSEQEAPAAGGTGYVVLARRYRSRDFGEVVGQEPIARTLQNAIRLGRTAHAYLFCGTRGVGKTSMARIFARALNATADLSERTQVEDAIMRGQDMDVIEIDGASNRGVDDAREHAAVAYPRARVRQVYRHRVHAPRREVLRLVGMVFLRVVEPVQQDHQREPGRPDRGWRPDGDVGTTPQQGAVHGDEAETAKFGQGG